MKPVSIKMFLPVHREVLVSAKTDGEEVQELNITYTHVQQMRQYGTGKKVDMPGLTADEKEILRDRVRQEYFK